MKKSRMKKILVVLLSIVLICSCFGPGNVYAAKKSKTVKTTKTVKVVKNVKLGTKITVGYYKYKVTKLGKKKTTVEVIGLTKKGKKTLKSIEIPATIRVRSKKGKNKGTYNYKVTSVGLKAFYGNKNIKKITIGKNVKIVRAYAFANEPKLKTVVIAPNSKLVTISGYVFDGNKKLKNINLSSAKKLKNVSASAFQNTKVVVEENKYKDTEEPEKILKYKYEIIPLLAPFNEYFYIKTNNPDPDSFKFVDESTKYDESGSITVSKTIFADVKYKKKATFRVKGGYIGVGSKTDGGTLVLQEKVQVKTNSYFPSYEFKNTSCTVKVPKVCDDVDYLIDTYSGKKKNFFDKMDAIQSGFNSICLYSGASIRGKLRKSKNSPYYGLSTSPHVDQTFYIQDPYYRESGKTLLASSLYPYRFDSIGFPSMMGSIAKRLSSKATYVWSPSAHYLIDVKYNGKTKTYGGAGSGGGQQILQSQIKYFFRFDNTSLDAARNLTLEKSMNYLVNYGKLKVPSDMPKNDGKITWEDVSKAAGDGKYIQLVLITSIFGGGGKGYTFMYDKGSSYPGYFSDAWYDGRYFNSWEFFEKGTKFSEHPTSTIIIKDPVIKYPEDGKKYYYSYKAADELENYDVETGQWKGYIPYYYNEESGTWIASIYTSSQVSDPENTSYNMQSLDNEEFKKQCSLTLEQVKEMGIDRNADEDPDKYLIYDMETKPGTRYPN